MRDEPAPLELWAGVECTIARLGDHFRDQTRETGHRERRGDIDLIAGLGVKAVRYPILWEAVAPDRPDRLDFAWQDERLEMLRERGIDVIGGLLHHGSGPSYTALTDPDFPGKLADYAARAAERYPWIRRWTPVNEPLTTARFSGLYGHWYPHKRDYPTFLGCLVNQCSGTLKAMRAIRARIPGAGLVQTEDLGKTFSTVPLRYQAAHENERRWLSLDLLCGRVDEAHPLWKFLRGAGIDREALHALGGGEARPDILGINHYLTSDRFLDHRTHLYPGHDSGGNGRDTYVDAEAVRVKRLADDTGFAPRLREAWQRYGIPIAITEVHHGCTRDEQLRWFAEAWKTAGALRGEGVDLRAVTLWSAFGNVDWRSLLTERRGLYDCGAFDIRGGGAPRPTIVARAARAYGHDEDFDHPVLDSPGWWRRPPRLYPWSGRCRPSGRGGRTLLITGATGTLGNAFARICEHRALPFRLTARDELDICDEAAIAETLDGREPWAVINAAGFVRVADAERERDDCFAANAEGPEKLARACAERGVALVTFSSDLVFDGTLGRPYVEDDAVGPAGAYGESKAEAERRVLAAHDGALVIRTSAFFGAWDRYNFAWATLSALAAGEPFGACTRSTVSPTFVPDLCHATLDLLIDGEKGLWHLANQSGLSWHEFARRIARAAGFDPDLIAVANSPRESATILSSSRGLMLRPLDEAIADYIRDVAHLIEPEAQIAAE